MAVLTAEVPSILEAPAKETVWVWALPASGTMAVAWQENGFGVRRSLVIVSKTEEGVTKRAMRSAMTFTSNSKELIATGYPLETTIEHICKRVSECDRPDIRGYAMLDRLGRIYREVVIK